MVQSVAVVRNTLTATLSGTTDFTSTGFGTPTAAIIVFCNANTTNNPQSDSILGIGLWDGTNQRAVGVHDGDNLATTVTDRCSSDSRGVMFGTAGTSTEYTVSSTTDGIRLTLDVDNTTLQRYCTVILLKGVSSDLRTFTPNAIQNATASVSGLSFVPSLVLIASITASPADVSPAGSFSFSLGIAESGGNQRLVTWSSANNSGTSTLELLFSETRCVGQVFSNSINWTGEITSWASDGWTMTTREGATNGDVVFALTLGGDVSFDMGTLTTPAATGNDSVTTTIQPDALLAVLSTATNTSLQTGNGAEGLSIGISDGTNDYQHGSTSGDNLGTTNAQSIASASKVIDLDDESSGFNNLADATVSSFGATSFTLNYSAVPVTATKGWWLAFGASTSAVRAIKRKRRIRNDFNHFVELIR